MLARCRRLQETSVSVVGDLNSISGQTGGDQRDDSEGQTGSADEEPEDELPLDGEAELSEAEVEPVDGDPALGNLPPGTSNRVVYAEELGPLKKN